MENIGLGLELMLVGMVTVFIILLIVIYGSQLLIKIVNKVSPAEAPAPKRGPWNKGRRREKTFVPYSKPL